MPFQLEAALSELTPEARERAAQVCAAQRARGMEPRDDSLLTFQFAAGTIDGTADTIAAELVFVDRIYHETPYGECVEEVLRKVAAGLKQRHKLTWTETWTIVRFYGPTMLKLWCLLQKRPATPPSDRPGTPSSPLPSP